ncbi:MAG: hypothetical protein AB8H03_23025 [Saprospiraceae bacterium]
MDKFLDLTKEQYKAFMALPIDVPLQMLNLLKFKEKVNDADISGAERYKEYMKATVPFFQKSNAKVNFYGDAKINLIGPQELEWDKVLIVEYAQKSDFIKMITTEGYPSEMRKSAIEDSRLIFCESSKK